MKPDEKLKELNRVLDHCKTSPFYRERLPERPLGSLEEIKNIPITTKEDLRRISPYGLICVPGRELHQYHETFGTTGTPVSTWFTREDLRYNAREIAMCGVNFKEDDTVMVRFPYAISAVAHMIHTAAQQKHACVIPVGARSTVSPFPRVVNLMQKLDVTILACLPLQAVLIAETAEMLGIKPDRDFPALRAICTAGEPLSAGRRKLLEDIWGVPLFDIYGMAEIGTAVVDCEFGRSHPLEDFFVFELLDENLKNDVKPGELGHLVITTLKKKAAPIVRYLTGDRASLVGKECACGAEISLEIRGRREDTISAGSRVLDLWDLDEIVSNLPCRRFWVAGPAEKGLHLVVEEEKTGDTVRPELVKRLENRYGIKLLVEVVPRGTLYDRSELMAVGVVGKPQYIYSALEMAQKKYINSART
ncbi:MAG: phenylacetate--CoA ligase family protein [Desulfocucumaceae bacterium]